MYCIYFDGVCGQELDPKPYLACRELVHVPGSLQNQQRCRGLAPTHQPKAGRTTLQFYMLVPLLHQEAQHVDMTAKLLSTNELKRYFKKDTTRIQKRLNQLWNDYNTSEMSTSSFLRKAGVLYSPTFQED